MFGIIQKIIDENPNLFAQLICEAVLGADSEHNFFMRYEGDNRIPNDKALVQHYSDLAAVILSKIDLSKLPAIDGEFICLKDWITHEMGPVGAYSWHYTNSDHGQMARTFFLKNEETFGYALIFAAELAYHGVPLYQRDDSGVYLPISCSRCSRCSILRRTKPRAIRRGTPARNTQKFPVFPVFPVFHFAVYGTPGTPGKNQCSKPVFRKEPSW
ncbi:hypothetical protein [Glaciimonas immobilis]|uniref:Uncharacterized protein n=1 Tax=Glaciimonas immobilis TaxID=728004 RepID=A0A840RSP8_9BURK|nr:hypothetical protein [Glaciimonas immobilis]KAF3997488.1 hypothetical protein HAV38_12470 [Glaciimonas immobilis]MBB5200835.1 hypothetical protein [Glaciimonas immobilis]